MAVAPWEGGRTGVGGRHAPWWREVARYRYRISRVEAGLFGGKRWPIIWREAVALLSEGAVIMAGRLNGFPP